VLIVSKTRSPINDPLRGHSRTLAQTMALLSRRLEVEAVAAVNARRTASSTSDDLVTPDGDAPHRLVVARAREDGPTVKGAR
jgi:hypothetical protein